jgi:hypothetical protein
LLIPTGYAQVSVHYDFEAHGTDDGRVVFGILAAAYNQGLAEIMFSSWRDSFDVVTATDVAFTFAEIRTSTDLVFVSTSPAAGGTVGGGSVPPNSAYLLKKTTALGGRKHRGRSYIPGVPREWVDGSGAISTTHQTLVNNAALAFLDFIAAADTSMQLLHTGTELPDEVTAWTCSQLLATQRRRLR